MTETNVNNGMDTVMVESFAFTPTECDIKRRIIDESLTFSQQLERYSESDDVYHRIWFINNFTCLVDGLLQEQPELDPARTIEFYLQRLTTSLHHHQTNNWIISAFFDQLWTIVDWALAKDQVNTQAFFASLLQMYLNTLTHANRTVFVQSISTIGKEQSKQIVPMICNSIVQLMQELMLQPHKCDSFDHSVADLIECLAGQVEEQFVSGFLCGYLEHLMRDQVANAEIQRCCVGIVGSLYSEGENCCISTAVLDQLRLFEAYCKLASDKRDVVRIEACSVLPVVSKRLCGEVRTRAVLSIYSSFLSDESRRVQEEAKCQLGKMIYSFHPHPIPASFALLMEELIAGAGGSGQESSRMRILQSLAFSFPAIVTAYLSSASSTQQPAVDIWAFLNSILKRLARIVNISIATSLSYGLHEIAALVGQSRAENDIFPLFLQFLRDQEAIRLGALEGMFQTCSCFSPAFLGNNLSGIIAAAMFNIKKSWRVRREVIRQLGKLASILPLDQSKQEIFRWICEFCKDPIGIVREEAQDSFVAFALLTKTGSVKMYKETVLENLKKMQESPLDRYRLMGQQIATRIGLVEKMQ